MHFYSPSGINDIQIPINRDEMIVEKTIPPTDLLPNPIRGGIGLQFLPGK
jgi:hypothetical protein